jgi:HK97 gp10 family phage protein
MDRVLPEEDHMIEWDRVQEQIIERAATGALAAARFGLSRAQEHAPVRAIFTGRQRGPAYSGRRPSQFGDPVNRKFAGDLPIRAKTQMARFTASKQRNRRVNVEHGRQSVLGDTGAGATERQLTLARGLSGLPEDSVRGHPNSLIPVRKKGKWRITGDFRKFDGGSVSGLANVSAVTQTRGIGGRRTISNVLSVNASSLLTSAGRYEVARAKKAGQDTPLYKGRVGGRLRGELRVSEQEKTGTEIWYYIESPTPYAKYQEFGTSRHRAQPFLRPALYESRGALRYEVRRAVDKSFAAPAVRSKHIAQTR